MPSSPLRLLPRDGQAVLHENFFRPPAFPDGLFDTLAAALEWRGETLRIFGKEHPVPRLVAYYGEFPYRYSGVTHPARPLPEVLRPLCAAAEEAAGFRFNSVLGNYYRDGQDSMGYHRDDEPEIDPACIASVSFGATRRFKLRHRESREVVTVELADGSLLLMNDCQTAWEHGVPKTRRALGGRINLTFRRMRAPTAGRASPWRSAR
ncbi:MAG: alpha-ketoglutarate-dependent dioxygenase AlkB [Gemmatimonadetes bacterium]|nr:alpha-ketoglutarate-dependent dioxygenase AlkB [Gemmatimonadota bacterium]